MGNISSKPKWAPIKYVSNDGICYLSDPPQYSPNVVIFEDGNKKIYPAKEIIAELKRQNKSQLWDMRYMSIEDREMQQAIRDLINRRQEKEMTID